MLKIFKRSLDCPMLIGIMLLVTWPVDGQGQTSANPSKAEIITNIKAANDYWQDIHPNPGNAFWDNAAYHTGNIEAYYVTGIEKYRDYSMLWAEQNQWMGAGSNDTTNWKYHYGESAEYVLFGDWQICFQTYIDLYNLAGRKDSAMVERAIGVMEYQMSTDNVDYWWWVDGLYMVMPVMTKLYQLTGNERYLQKLHEYFLFAKSIMWDEEESLFYRDAGYVYPDHTTESGKKDFWARGNGWAFAGLAKVLQNMPEENQYRSEFLDVYNDMAVALVNCQHDEGYWSRSLLDEAQAPGYETSGTAFFTYGFFWGVNNEVLDSAKYTPVALKGLDYLNNVALQDDGRVGYVQPIGSAAVPGQNLYPTSTSNFGVGAFLLALSEASRWTKGDFPMFLESASVLDETHLRVDFSETVDPVKAKNTENYSVENVTVLGVTISEDKKSVIINCSQIPYGEHQLVVHNIESNTGKKVVDGSQISFTRLSDIDVTASAHQKENPPENTLDFNLDTRWSAESSTEYIEENGEMVETLVPQWIQYDLGEVETISSVNIAFYSGDQRNQIFKIALSEDGETFSNVFEGESGGDTTEPEQFDFEDTKARYVKLICYGNSQNNWNSITEVRINSVTTSTSPSIIKQTDDVFLYPNPFSGGNLIIVPGFETVSDVSFTIVDMHGRVKYEGTSESTANQFEIQPLGLSPGIHTLILRNKEFFRSSKLIVK